MIDDYWRSDEGRQYVYRQDAALWEVAKKVACQGYACAQGHGTRQEGAVRTGGRHEACHVRCGKTDETDRTAKGRGDGREQSRGKQKHVSSACGIHAKVLRIAVAQEQGIQRLHHQQSHDKSQ